jgi:hypothetical protein
MSIDTARAKEVLAELLKEVSLRSGEARTEKFTSLRAVDAKVREVRMTLREAGAATLADEMERDSDFDANSRRVRLEALANYCRTAIKFFDTGVITQKKPLFKGPDLSQLTSVMPDLERIIQARWLEAQRCQHAHAYLAAVIVMGSILEALLLARASQAPSRAYQATSAPKDRTGKAVAIHEWTLSALIDVSVECGWLKSDRGNFSHALRNSRNVVHPYEHARSRADFDEATCKVCWHVLNASVDDLLAGVKTAAV